MNVHTQKSTVQGPAGKIEMALDMPAEASKGVVVIAHPHPLFGGTLDNKVVQTLAREYLPSENLPSEYLPSAYLPLAQWPA